MYRLKNYTILGYIFLIVLFFSSGEVLKLIPNMGDTVKSFSTLNSTYPDYNINFKVSKNGLITITATGSVSSQLTEENRSILAKEMAKLAISSYKGDYKSVTVVFITQSIWESFFKTANPDVYYNFSKESVNT